MTKTAAFGKEFGKRLSAASSTYATRAFRNTTMAITEARYDNPTFTLSVPPAPEDAFVVAMQLTYYEKYEYFENDKQAPPSSLVPRETFIYDLKRKPIFNLNQRFHSLHYYFPRETLNAIADEAERPRFEDLRYRPGQGVDDPVMRMLSETLLPYFSHPEEMSALFMDHVMLAIGQHVAVTYGGLHPREERSRGGLERWQEKRAKEFLAANLAGEPSLAVLAAECGISVRHFTRAFRLSTGLSPHNWLLQVRVDTSKVLLRHQDIKLTDVAAVCGFADQSHFTRVFTKLVGASPGKWRKSVLS